VHRLLHGGSGRKPKGAQMRPLPDLSVRELQRSDLTAYKALRDHALSHHGDAFTSDAATESLRTAQSYAARLGSDGDGSFTLGAFRGDRLVGAVTCDRDARVKVLHIGHVTGMMVHGDEQGQGIGRALIDALIERAAADPELHQLTLNVTAGNAVAERLYERSGFVRYGTLPRAIRVGGVFHDKHHMLLTLK
jgi:RimJ/RimL family protein N-acetyltransferase